MDSSQRTHRFHATRVAVVATLVVTAGYVVAVVVLNVLVVHRLTVQADVRLRQRLIEAEGPNTPPPGSSQTSTDNDHDLDDTPQFVWTVTRFRTSTPLTVGAPALSLRRWHPGATSFDLHGTPFRFQAVDRGGGWLVAGESVAQLDRVRGALLAPEVLFGGVLLVVTFVGSLLVGLRASAPLEVVHRRQVEFTADASHELRTPLAVIEAEVELALTRSRSRPEYEAILGRIAGEGRRLRRIVDDLLWLARIDDERSAMPGGGEADVAAIALASVARFRPIAAGNDVDLRVEVAHDRSAQVRAEPGWIDRLVGVLVDNACKYAGSGGHVDVGVRIEGNRVVLRVDDSGPGIPVEQRRLVLDRFHRGSDGPGGAGLGLAIADSVVRATNGTWLIADAPSGGARLEVSWRKDPHGHPRTSRGDRDDEPGLRPTSGPDRPGPTGTAAARGVPMIQAPKEPTAP
jgi:signal transduction histidine kinase